MLVKDESVEGVALPLGTEEGDGVDAGIALGYGFAFGMTCGADAYYCGAEEENN